LFQAQVYSFGSSQSRSKHSPKAKGKLSQNGGGSSSSGKESGQMGGGMKSSMPEEVPGMIVSHSRPSTVEGMRGLEGGGGKMGGGAPHAQGMEQVHEVNTDEIIAHEFS